MAKKQEIAIHNFAHIGILLKEKYSSFLIGLLLLIIILLFAFMYSAKKPEVKITNEEQTTETQIQTTQKTYKVQEGDYLWKIAEENYGSGYSAYDIALANNITNPSVIYKDQLLIIPEVTPKLLTKGETSQTATAQVTETSETYTVQKDDYLWSIAEKFYGDGFAWVKIAEINSLSNPSLIHEGNELKIPKN